MPTQTQGCLGGAVKNVLLVVAAFVVFCVFIFLMTPGDGRRARSPSTPQKAERAAEEDYSIYAYSMAKKFVLQQLRCPSTADFPWSASRIDSLGDGHYKVVGYVDAQNAFGAQVRTNFICEVCTKDGDNWSLLDLVTYPQ